MASEANPSVAHSASPSPTTLSASSCSPPNTTTASTSSPSRRTSMVMASWIWPATRGKKKAGDDVVDRPSTMWWIGRQPRFLVSIKAIASAVRRGVVHAMSHMTASRLARLRNLIAVSDMSGKDGEVDLRGGAAAKTGWAEPARAVADRMMGVSAELAVRWRQ
uniref:Uncharacterized protein n=1 Tax=Oryza rufipogon TaxID=4529 RepID=A0A0E0P157_ORYRU